MFKQLRDDMACILERDPAARTRWEVLTCYPGLHALYLHKLARWFWLHGLRWLGRFISQLGRWLTGIEIHPGAKVGDGARIGSNAVVVKEVPAGATVVGIPGRIVEEGAEKAARFAAYAVAQEQDDPYAKAIQELVEHSEELERALTAVTDRLAQLERDAEAAARDPLRAVK